MSFTFTRYDAATHKTQWDAFIRNAKNGHFMFERAYMDYHADRFTDHSVMVFDAETLIVVLPANIRDDTLYTHQGLTFGGFVYGAIRMGRMLDIVPAMATWLKESGVAQIQYKYVPHIYHQVPAEEDRYALSFLDTVSRRCDVSTTVNPAQRGKVSDLRRRGIKKAQKNGLKVVEGGAWSAFWDVLTARLSDKYETNPVHTLAEMECLHAAFPHNIRLFTVQDETGAVLAGSVVYETATVAHAQYIASGDAGLEQGALDLLFETLIGDVFAHKRYFDFGISTEKQGTYLNRALIAFKEGFGGGGVTYDAALYRL